MTRHEHPGEWPCFDCPHSLPPGPETCPSLCVERSHPGREHDPAEDGCYCWQLCAMGPTCPGANAGLDRGCWRVADGDA